MPTPPHPTGPVREILRQLQLAGITTSDRAVAILPLHADRHQLTLEDLVSLLTQLRRTPWTSSTLSAAARLLAELGQLTTPISPYLLAAEVDTAAGVEPTVDELRALLTWSRQLEQLIALRVSGTAAHRCLARADEVGGPSAWACALPQGHLPDLAHRTAAGSCWGDHTFAPVGGAR